ncbi:division plane positioning ATPase MipZ [Caedibacter taeniospiralis]|jgi:chromosome partitioning protein|uniref:division plane positioning ATPase MipZ n=1 Tax=Caedibacter taeniospiralis TaxID=28907 RepID=UPI0037C1801C
MIVVIGNTKGGVGKSTIACNIATFLANQKKDVCLVDVDKQKTSTAFINSRDKTLPRITCVQLKGDVLDSLSDLAKKYDEIIVDAGGYDSVELRTAILAANKLIVPIKASQIDLWAAEDDGGINDIAGKAKAFNRGLEIKSLLSMTPTHAMITEKDDAKGMLEDFNNINDILKTSISERKVYRDAFTEGRGVIEMNNDKAIIEISHLCKEIYNGI